MASVTKTYTENQDSSYRATWTVAYSANDVEASGTYFVPNPLTVSAKYVYSGKDHGVAFVRYYVGKEYTSHDDYVDVGASNDFGGGSTAPYMASGSVYNIPFARWAGDGTGRLRTSEYFNANNPTESEVVLKYMPYQIHLVSMRGADYTNWVNICNEEHDFGAYTLLTAKVKLNAPPTFSSTQVSFINDYEGSAYVGLTTAQVTISGSSAKYGGTISASSLTIGNQTVTGSGNGTISILLDSAGTFTPTVTVTDSRGQTTTKTLDPIVVNPYVAPEVAFTLERTNASGTKDDEGTYVVATASFNWTDAIATLSQPTVSAIDSDGTTLSVSATWYTDRALTTAVDWSSTSSWSSPKTLYGRIGTLPVNESSQVTITPNDSEGSGTAQTQTLASAFYTIDFLAGGHGIAFGQPASQTGLHCDMEATFNRTVDVGEEVSSKNILLHLDTTATSGTDYEIYTALVNLGWDADVGGMLDVKALINKLLEAVSVDYIVEEGTSGIWTYRKWNSGIAECWGQYYMSIPSMTAWGSCYYSPYVTINYPSGLFKVDPSVSITRTGGLEGWAGCQTTNVNSVVGAYLLRPATGSGTTVLAISAKGGWK